MGRDGRERRHAAAAAVPDAAVPPVAAGVRDGGDGGEGARRGGGEGEGVQEADAADGGHEAHRRDPEEARVDRRLQGAQAEHSREGARRGAAQEGVGRGHGASDEDMVQMCGSRAGVMRREVMEEVEVLELKVEVCWRVC